MDQKLIIKTHYSKKISLAKCQKSINRKKNEERPVKNSK